MIYLLLWYVLYKYFQSYLTGTFFGQGVPINLPKVHKLRSLGRIYLQNICEQKVNFHLKNIIFVFLK